MSKINGSHIHLIFEKGYFHRANARGVSGADWGHNQSLPPEVRECSRSIGIPRSILGTVLKRDVLTVEIHEKGFLLGVFKIPTRKLGEWVVRNGFFLTKNGKEFVPVPVVMWEAIGAPKKNEGQLSILNI